MFVSVNKKTATISHYKSVKITFIVSVLKCLGDGFMSMHVGLSVLCIAVLEMI